MSNIKTQISRREDLLNVATHIAELAGAIYECEGHSGTYLTNSDTDAESQAYAIGTNMHKRGEVSGSRTELMDALQSVMAEVGSECPSCSKNRRD
ncbi:hypothetical protein [Rhizobium leguminosarum]|uniref:hypothetical protein n=1 Tax=Rhizobium leguminosarum TaxID=384 RepID=UPI0039657554